MPILPQEELVPNYGGPSAPVFAPPPDKKGPTFLEGLSAVFEEGNTVGSTLKFFEYEKLISNRYDDNYNVWDDIAGYEDEAPAFVHSWNANDTAITKRRIDDERATREQISRAGSAGIAGSILAGILDPVNLVPVGGTALKAKSLGQGIKTGLEVGFKSSLLTEVILQGTQIDRSAGDTALNVATGSLFGGILGGVGGAMNGGVGAKDAKLAERLDAEFADALAGAEYVDAGSLSAASARTGSASDVKPAGSLGVLEFEAKNPLSDNPIARGLTSPSTETNRLTSELAETPYYLRGNAEGVASPVAVESRVKGWQGPLADAITAMDDQFSRYRMGRPKKMGDQMRAGVEDLTGSQKLSYAAFKEEVAKAMRRGDQSPIPEAAAAAKAYRKLLVEPLKDDAIRFGLLPEGVEPVGAASYLTRVYNIPKILEQRNGFTETLTDWFEVTQPRGEKALSRAELRAEAEEVVAQILGQAPGRTGYDMVANLRGPLKERTLTVPDEVLEPWLENDAERVLRIYTRTMSADVELARAFGRPDMKEQLDALPSSYDRLFRRTPDGPKQKELSDRLARDISDLEAMRDRIRGQYKIPDNPYGIAVRLGRSIRTLNYLRLLGGMTVSALPDLARVTLAGGGLGKTMTNGLLPMVGNLKKFRLAASEVRMAGTALDMVLDTRAQQMADIFDDFGRVSSFERGLTYAGEKFGLVSLMAPWNASMKQFAGVMIQGRMLKAITGDASPAEIKRLRFLGIDADMSERIGKEFRKHGEKGGGIWSANTADWTDVEAARVYRAALVKEVDGHVVSPGQEKPLWMSTELGKTIGQFKSFTFSAMSRQLIRGLQERDGAVAQAVVLGTSLGMLSYYLKTKAAGKEPSAEPQKWVIEGLDRSGMLGWTMEANNMLEKASQNRLGLNPALGVDPAGRYVSRSPLEAMLGPSAGLVNDAWNVAGATSSAVVPDENGQTKPLSRAALHKARRLLPFQNTFYLNWLFNSGEDAAGDAMGLEEAPK